MTSNAIILMTSRSGSSMVAGIFAAHGYWYGTGAHVGYFSYENQEVKAFLRTVPMTRGQFVEGGRALFHPAASPWFWKGGVEYWPLFKHLRAERILVRRNIEATVDSVCEKNPGTNREYAMWLTKQRHAMMDSIGGTNVYTDDLVAGDYSSINRALEACGVTPDHAKIRRVIDPKLWRH